MSFFFSELYGTLTKITILVENKEEDYQKILTFIHGIFHDGRFDSFHISCDNLLLVAVH